MPEEKLSTLINLPRKIDFSALKKSPRLTRTCRALWRIIKPPEHRSDPLDKYEHIQVLHFKNHEAATQWNWLAQMGLKPEYYRRAYKSQTDKNLSDFALADPFVLQTQASPKELRVEKGGNVYVYYRGIEINRELFEYNSNRFIINSHEKDAGWCWICRGLGFVAAIRSKEKPITEDGYIQQLYHLHCPHHYFQEEDALRNRGKKKRTAKDETLPF